MIPALNGYSAIRRFEGSDAIEIHDGITFDFYTGLPHMFLSTLLPRVHHPWTYEKVEVASVKERLKGTQFVQPLCQDPL